MIASREAFEARAFILDMDILPGQGATKIGMPVSAPMARGSCIRTAIQ